MVTFAIVGGGWRSEFFLRIAEQLPHRFQVSGMVVRNRDRALELERRFGVATYSSVSDLVAAGGGTSTSATGPVGTSGSATRTSADSTGPTTMRRTPARPSFTVVSVPRETAPFITLQLTRLGMPVLCETPPAKELDDLIALHEALPPDSKVQIAEQYIFQPNHAARIDLVKSGLLGRVSQAQVSAAHDYHGISLIRHLLGVRFEDARIKAMEFTSPIVEGPNRAGPPNTHEIRPSRQVVAWLEFGDKLGVYDFCDHQYFSWARSPRVLVRGESGEINNMEVRYLKSFDDPVEAELRRIHAGHGGNLEGHHLKSIDLGTDRLYTNPFIPGRLADDEIAVATCLQRMAEYVDGGPSFYSVAEASQDHYLAMLIHQAARGGEAIRSSRQPWATE